MTGNSRYVRSLIAAAGMLTAVASAQTAALGQSLPVAEDGAAARLKDVQDAIASGRLIRAKNILVALNSPSNAQALSDDDRVKVLTMLGNVTKRVKALPPISVSLQTAEESVDSGDLRTAEYHARAVVDAPKATNEEVSQARVMLDRVTSERVRLAPSVQTDIESAVVAFDAGRYAESKAMLDSVSRSGVSLSGSQSATVAAYQNKLIDLEHSTGQRFEIERVDAGMMQPGVIKRRKPAQPATPSPAPSDPAPETPAPAPSPVAPEAPAPAPAPVAPEAPAPAPAPMAPEAPAPAPAPDSETPEPQEPMHAEESTSTESAPVANQPEPSNPSNPWWNNPSWRWNWSPSKDAPSTVAQSEQPVGDQPAPSESDPLEQARVIEASAQLAEADAAFDAARYNEAANRYEALLNQSASLMTADQRAHCEMRLNECRARLGAGGASILDSTLESRKLAREAAVAEYDSYMADSRKSLMSGDADAARSNLAAARLRIRSAAQFFAQTENESFENALDSLKSQIDSAAVAIETRTREDQARQQKRDAELAQEEAANARARKIADAIERTRDLQAEQKYADALQVVDEILFLDPVNPTGLLLREALTDLDIMQRYTNIRRKKRVSGANYRLDAEEATIIGPDVMNFADDWPKISARRGEPIAFADAEDNRRTLALLESRKQPAVIENSTLEEALNFVKQIASVDMDVDWDSLDTIGVNKETPVSLTLSKVSVKVLLDKILERASEDPSAAASWTIKEGMIFVASKEVINRDRVLAIYDIKDLLVVIPDFEGAPEFNLQSVLQSGQGGSQSPFQDQGDQQEDDPIEGELTDELVEIIQKSVDPDGWEDNGGETGYIQRFQGNLIVTQTPANHREIRNLLTKLREQRSMQVNVESRFLLVSQSFFEQIGFDIDVYWNGNSNQVRSARAGAPTQQIRPSDFFDFTNGGLQRRVQGSVPGTGTSTTQSVVLPSPLSVIGTPNNSLGLTELLTQGSFATTVLGEAPALGIGGQFLDDIQVDFLVKATQADRRTVTLTAPRLTFTNGQSSWVSVATQKAFVSDLTPVVSESAVGFDPQLQVTNEGVVLKVDGTISADRRYVFLTVETAVSKLAGFEQVPVTAVAGGQLVNSADTSSFIQLPTVTVQEVATSVTVPDQGTLLLGGQRLITEGEVETGVPVLSKLPIIKRFFTNRTETKEEATLLILIKPTILIQTEEEEKHFPGISQLQGASGG